MQFFKQHDMVLGFPLVKKLNYCEDGVYGKLARLPFQLGKSWRPEHRLHLVHANVCGPMQIESHGGNRYFLLFIDDYSYVLDLSSQIKV